MICMYVYILEFDIAVRVERQFKLQKECALDCIRADQSGYARAEFINKTHSTRLEWIPNKCVVQWWS